MRTLWQRDEEERRHTRLAGDGAALYDQVFAREQPLVRINPLVDDSDLAEYRGFKNLLLGTHGHYRNPRAHRARVSLGPSCGC